jgi:hypothetical protein
LTCALAYDLVATFVVSLHFEAGSESCSLDLQVLEEEGA